MSRPRQRIISALLVAAAMSATSITGVAAVAGSRQVAPGSAAQVAAAVASSSKILKLSATAMSQLTRYGNNDGADRLYPSVFVCGGNSHPCVYGDTASHRVVVLYGDSHAMMWLPAIAPAAKRAHDKLVLFWISSCPVASITDYSYADGGSYGTVAGCNAFRATAIREIRSMKPIGVVVAERGTLIYSEPRHIRFTSAQWSTALISTIRQIKSKSTKLAVLEDPAWFNLDPMKCLAFHPSAIQKCAQATPNTVNPGQQVAERAAASATGAGYITTEKWLCTKTCSPVVANIITHRDYGHLSGTYAAYLTNVVGQALGPYLK